MAETKDLKIKLELENRQLKAKLSESKRELRKFKQATDKTSEGMGGMKTIARALGPAIAAAFSAQAIISFGRKVFDVTAEFQKLDAVLTNTLGSRSEAQKSLQMITAFAAKTPFSVLELSDAFVKLTNQGFKPTQRNMKQLGDLASSTGKSFDQLAEGILDAQTFQFERMKEFGIKASQQGDKITFTFKGVKTTVDKTASAVNKYILSLGDLKGVSGSMEAISGTLGGKLSNLGDTFDAMALSIGTKLNGAFGGVIESTGRFLSNVTKLINGNKDHKQAVQDTYLALDRELSVIKNFQGPASARNRLIEVTNKKYKDYLPNLIKENATIKEINGLQKSNVNIMKQRLLFMSFEEELKVLMESQKAAIAAGIAAEEAKAKFRADPALQDREAPFAGLGLDDESLEELNKNLDKAEKELKARYEKLAEALGTTLSGLDNMFGEKDENPFEGASDGVKTLKDELTELLKAMEDIFPSMDLMVIKDVELAKNAKEYAQYLRERREELKDLTAEEQRAINTTALVGETMAGVVESGIKGDEDMADSFKGAIKRIINASLAGAVAKLYLAESKWGVPGIAIATAGASILGGVFSGLLSSFAEGGVTRGSGLAMVGDNPGGKEFIVPSQKLDSFIASQMGGAGGGVPIYGVIKGEDILLSSERASKRMRR